MKTTPVTVAPGITRRTLVSGTAVMLCEFTLAPGAVISNHAHPHEQAGYVLSGRLRITVNGQTSDLGPGDTYCAPSNVPHSALILEPAVVLDAFSPPREDYL